MKTLVILGEKTTNLTLQALCEGRLILTFVGEARTSQNKISLHDYLPSYHISTILTLSFVGKAL